MMECRIEGMSELPVIGPRDQDEYMLTYNVWLKTESGQPKAKQNNGGNNEI